MPTPADWRPGTVATGYWLRDHGDGAQPADPGLERFVAAGAPPVYAGEQARPAELSQRIAQEDGATRACEQIESTLT